VAGSYWTGHNRVIRSARQTENGRARVNDAKSMQDSRFRALALNHLCAGNPLTTGEPEFTCLEFGSPIDTQKRNCEWRKLNWLVSPTY
jgi:hypothetical protein